METSPVTPVAQRSLNGTLPSASSLTHSTHHHNNYTPNSSAAMVETPKGPPLARVATSVPGVHIAQYSNVDVLELDIGANTVMRRVSNGSVNATQILKLAGLERSRRQKALDRDIGCRFEVIQGGAGKYQGTWIPLDDAVQLAKQYNVYHLLVPLFDFDMSMRPQIRAPTQYEIEERRRELAQQSQSRHNSASSNGNSAPSASAVAAAAAAAAAMPQNPDDKDQPVHDQSVHDQSVHDQSVHDQSMHDQFTQTQEDEAVDKQQPQEPRDAAKNNGEKPQLSTLAPPLSAKPEASLATLPDQPFSPEELSTHPPLELREGDSLAELSREVVTELFLSANRGETKPLTEILAAHATTEIEPDVPIDDAGHTALHWAAALGKVPLVADLVSHGANCRRGNRKGESPLVRAVLVTNSSDNQTFGELLDLLFPCLHLGDAQGRTVLHHIALTAGIPGRSEASRYYLDALLEWAVRCRGASGIQWLVDELADAQDANGDTALNIAARLGSKQIAQQLVEIGAAIELPNRAGLRPADFGVLPTRQPLNNFNKFGAAMPNATSTSTPSGTPAPATPMTSNANNSTPTPHNTSRTAHHLHQLHHHLNPHQRSSLAASAAAGGSRADSHEGKTHSRSGSRAPMDGAERRQELGVSCQTAIETLDKQLSMDLASKDRTLQAVHARLKETTENLDKLQARHASLRDLQDTHLRAQKRLKALESAATSENERFNSENAKHFAAAPIPDTNFDADQPFRINSESELRRLPPKLLQARVQAYKQNEQQLVQLRNELRNSTLDGEAKFRKVVAQCTSSDENKVDEILEDLLAAVERGDQPKFEDSMEIEA